MIQVMHTVADYVHDAKYKMGQRNNLRDFIFKHII